MTVVVTVVVMCGGSSGDNCGDVWCRVVKVLVTSGASSGDVW